MREKPEVKPPFKWTGGKNRMWDAYSSIFWPNGKFDTFVDLFCGAGSVSMWIKKNYPDVKIVMNDNNAELMEMYRTIKNQYAAFEKQYLAYVEQYLPLKKEDRKKLYLDLKTEYCFGAPSELVAATNLYFMLQINFNGLWKIYKKWGGKYSSAPGTLKEKAAFFDLSRTRAFHSLLKEAELCCGDFEDVSGNGKCYYYADPPYRDSVMKYDGAFTDDDQVRLVNFLKSKSDEGHFISESNKEVGDKFWQANFGDDHNINVVPALYTAGRGTSLRNVKEVLVTNF